tara:strand:+ start:6982 stop:7275 length:294 start_codon:yes stop_codon:yes gene_type:complete
MHVEAEPWVVSSLISVSSPQSAVPSQPSPVSRPQSKSGSPAHLVSATAHLPSSQAKTTKKITLRLTCTNCKTVRLKPIKRAKHFEICDKKPKGKGMY